ncbi:ribonuclease H-like domain-containing protein [Tanacetum coccineum]|uniref:Ribonuclease H-like domain-containing protein n=1 Tax=Tanacetum coccineum TaxID=301880 RepID=A0ABQ5GBZ5_9ASTR
MGGWRDSGDDGGGGSEVTGWQGWRLRDDDGGEGRVEARGGGDRIDPLVRTLFGLGRKTRRKSFPAAADGGLRWGGGGGGGRNKREKKVDKTPHFVEEPVEIMDQEIKKLKRKKITLVKVRWNSKRGLEFTWEREDYMTSKYHQLFVDRADESANHFELYGHLILIMFVESDWYSICSHAVIMEMIDVYLCGNCLEAACASGGSPAGIHGLFSGRYCGLAGRMVTLRVSMAGVKGVTTGTLGNPQQALKYKGIFDSGCSRHMTGNKDFPTDYQDINGGFVVFGGSARGGKITGKRKIRIDKLDFEDVFFVKELKFNLLSVSQMCDKKNSVLFTEIECLVLSLDFKLLDESQVLFRVPRQSNTYNFDLKNVVPSGDLTCLFAKAIIDESCEGKPCKRILVTKPHNKTPYELIIGRPPSISFMRPFGCPVTILNTLDPLGKFDRKAEEGFLVGYSVNSKAFRVFNSQTRKVEENLHVNFLENKPNIAGQGPNWLFDIDSLTNSMNYQPVTAGNQTNKNAGPQEANGDTGLKKSVDARQSEEKNVSTQQYIVFPLWSSISSSYKSSDETYKNDTADDAAGETPVQKPASENEQALKNVLDKMMD